MTFRGMHEALAPEWLRGDEGTRVLWTLEFMADTYAERAKLGMLASCPSNAPEDALPYLSRDRKIIRGIGEPSAAFRARLLTWLDDHKTRGNPYALLNQLRTYLGAGVRVRSVDMRGNWFTIERDGTRSCLINQNNFDWDGLSTQWSRFWVIVYPTAAGVPWAEQAAWGAGQSWGEMDSLGTTATQAEIDGMMRIIREWKPAGTRCDWGIVAFDDASFDPAGADVPSGDYLGWHVPTSGAEVPIRLGTARYMRGPR